MRWFKVETLRQDEWLKIVTEIYVCMLVTLDMVNHYFHSVCFILCVCYVVQNKKFAFNLLIFISWVDSVKTERDEF